MASCGGGVAFHRNSSLDLSKVMGDQGMNGAFIGTQRPDGGRSDRSIESCGPAIVSALNNVTTNLLSVVDAIDDLATTNKEAIDQAAGRIVAAVHTNKAELCKVRASVDGVQAAVKGAAQAAASADATECNDADILKADAGIAYTKIKILLGLLGKGDALDCYGKSNAPEQLEYESAAFVLGKNASASDITKLLEMAVSMNRGGVTATRHGVITKTKKKGVTKEAKMRIRIVDLKRGIHQSIGTKVAGAWMLAAPGFEAYIWVLKAEEQPRELVDLMKEAFKKDPSTGLYKFLENTSVFGPAFEAACKQLMATCSKMIKDLMAKIERVMPGEDIHSGIREDVLFVDDVQGYRGRAIHEYNEGDGYLPQQVAFVVTKILYTMYHVLSVHEPRFRRAMDNAHYGFWLKQSLRISDIVLTNSTEEVLSMTAAGNFRPCSATNVYGVTIRGALSRREQGLIRYLITGESSQDLDSNERRLRTDYVVEENCANGAGSWDSGNGQTEEEEEIVEGSQMDCA